MFGRTLPDRVQEDDNLTDVNNGGSATDEDGELEQEHNDTDTNTLAAEDEDEDTTPPIHALAVKTTLVNGKEQTEIVATVTLPAVHATEAVEYRAVVKDEAGRVQKDPDTGAVLYETLTHFPVLQAGGITSKRLVVPGAVSAFQLATHIYNIAKW